MDGSDKRAKKLYQIMQGLDISARELHRRSGVHWGSISRYLNGQSKLNDLPILERLADGLGIHICYFFIDDDENIDILEQAVSILEDHDRSEVLRATIERLRLEGKKEDPNAEMKKDMAEMKNLLRQLVNQPQGKAINFRKAAAPKTSPPDKPKKPSI